MLQTSLRKRHCQACDGKAPALTASNRRELLSQLNGWKIKGQELEKEFLMKNFLAAVDFIRRIAPVAEAEDHHPDLYLTGYRHLRINLSTHSIGALSENDFIMAAKIDAFPKKLKLKD